MPNPQQQEVAVFKQDGKPIIHSSRFNRKHLNIKIEVRVMNKVNLSVISL
ncbi:hypothetical protein RINTHM_7260 [Richelia intracellularis HM01]|nr:hypothetical protein RINTHM_7260 [Richelia intracellularis HM01]